MVDLLCRYSNLDDLLKPARSVSHYQVRKYQPWYRHITLSMLAAAFLALTATR